MTDGLESKLRVAVAAVESLRAKRTNLAVALAESGTSFHRAMRHASTDWRGGCTEPECIKAWQALSANGEKS